MTTRLSVALSHDDVAVALEPVEGEPTVRVILSIDGGGIELLELVGEEDMSVAYRGWWRVLFLNCWR